MPRILNMVTHQDIDLFLGLFQKRKDQYGLVFFPRERTLNGLVELEITSIQRTEAIDRLTSDHLKNGPFPHDVIVDGSYWEFRTLLEGKEIYIRLSLGLEEGAVFCLACEPWAHDR